MVNLIKYYLELHCTPDYLDVDYGVMAEDLLKLVEDKGMNPPFCELIYYSTFRDGGNGCEWETEE